MASFPFYLFKPFLNPENNFIFKIHFRGILLTFVIGFHVLMILAMLCITTLAPNTIETNKVTQNIYASN